MKGAEGGGHTDAFHLVPGNLQEQVRHLAAEPLRAKQICPKGNKMK